MINLFKFNTIILIACLCSNFQLAATENKEATILAKVNEEEITLGHLITTVSKLPPEYLNFDDDYLLDGILDQIIKQEILAQSMNNSDKSITIQFENELRALRAKYAIEFQLRDFPTEKQIVNAYDEAKRTIGDREEFNASHILVETKEKATDLVTLLENGSDFSELAKMHSTGPSGPNGGNLGWFGLGQMVPEFEAAVMVLEKGKVSQPVKTKFGWHLVKLNDRRLQSMPSLEELRPEITQSLKQDRIDKIVALATQNAKIEIFADQIDAGLIRDTNLLKNSK